MAKFSDWLADYSRGALDDELTAALEEVAHEVVLSEKAGTVTLKLAMTEKGGGVIVSAQVSAAPPKSKREAFFYVSDDGLSTRDPRQPTLPYEEHDTEENQQP